MALTDRIVKGMIIMYNNEPHLVAEREFYKPGKGNALNRTKLRGLRSGKVISATYKSGEKVDELQVETKNCFSATMMILMPTLWPSEL
jgi:elongation factor P